MSSHDGYSSDEEDSVNVPKKSQVYLGFVDTEFENADDDPTIEDSFIGGQPVWLHEDSRPSEDLIKCKNCQSKLKLVIQAFSPLEGTLYDRVIYVFGCSNAACNRKEGSIRAIRGIRKDPKKIAELTKQEQDEIKNQLDEKLKLDNAKDFLFDDKKDVSNPFGGANNSNPFGSDSNPFSTSSDLSNPFGSSPFDKPKPQAASSSFASIASKNAPPKKQPKKLSDEKLPEYPGYFIYVDQEKFQKKPQNNKKLPENIQIDDGVLDLEAESAGSSSNLAPETQAIASALQDKVFQHFSEIVNYNPLQVLRYELGGEPLLFSSKDEVSTKVVKHLIPKPAYNPSSQRQFELQVMPKIIIDFEKNDTDILNGIEWATILVYTDVEDYVPQLDENHVGYVEEWVGVQWEEPITKKNRQ